MSARSAILMAAVFNFLGVLVMTMVNASVAATIYNMVDFGGNTADALTALCAALVALSLIHILNKPHRLSSAMIQHWQNNLRTALRRPSARWKRCASPGFRFGTPPTNRTALK